MIMSPEVFVNLVLPSIRALYQRYCAHYLLTVEDKSAGKAILVKTELKQLLAHLVEHGEFNAFNVVDLHLLIQLLEETRYAKEKLSKDCPSQILKVQDRLVDMSLAVLQQSSLLENSDPQVLEAVLKLLIFTIDAADDQDLLSKLFTFLSLLLAQPNFVGISHLSFDDQLFYLETLWDSLSFLMEEGERTFSKDGKVLMGALLNRVEQLTQSFLTQHQQQLSVCNKKTMLTLYRILPQIFSCKDEAIEQGIDYPLLRTTTEALWQLFVRLANPLFDKVVALKDKFKSILQISSKKSYDAFLEERRILDNRWQEIRQCVVNQLVAAVLQYALSQQAVFAKLAPKDPLYGDFYSRLHEAWNTQSVVTFLRESYDQARRFNAQHRKAANLKVPSIAPSIESIAKEKVLAMASKLLLELLFAEGSLFRQSEKFFQQFPALSKEFANIFYLCETIAIDSLEEKKTQEYSAFKTKWEKSFGELSTIVFDERFEQDFIFIYEAADREVPDKFLFELLRIMPVEQLQLPGQASIFLANIKASVESLGEIIYAFSQVQGAVYSIYKRITGLENKLPCGQIVARLNSFQGLPRVISDRYSPVENATPLRSPTSLSSSSESDTTMSSIQEQMLIAELDVRLII